MKKILLIVFLSLITVNGYAQDIKKNPESDACECIDKIDINETKEVQFKEVEVCIKDAIMGNQLLDKLLGAYEEAKDSTSTKKEVNITIDATEGYEQLERKLIDNCEALKILLLNFKPSSNNSYSANEKAMEFYQQAYQEYSKENFEIALELYSKAVKEDKKFAFAWDMVGISHRRLGNYKEAVKAYKKSLKIDPKGKMPLQNLPIAYRMLEDYDKAAAVYKDLIKYYPEDPEGYYGLSQTATLMKDQDMAVDNMMIAYKMYASVNSPYQQDAQISLVEMYNEMNSNGELELFMKYANKHDIKFEDSEKTDE